MLILHGATLRSCSGGEGPVVCSHRAFVVSCLIPCDDLLMHTFWLWLYTVTGLSNASGPWYLWWSGIGSDIGEITLIGGVVMFYRHHTCHVDHCWRLARHRQEIDGAEYMLCRKHHPRATKLKAEHPALDGGPSE